MDWIEGGTHPESILALGKAMVGIRSGWPPSSRYGAPSYPYNDYRTMTDRGKYHGQRLTAQQVTSYYATGDRDFGGAVLRGCNFRGAELSGADFSGADIRSARFVGATLRGAQFNHARGGLQRRWRLGQWFGVALIAASTGLLQGFAGAWIGIFISSSSERFIAGVASLILITGALVLITRQGFTLRALGGVAAAVAFSGAFAVAFAVAFDGPGALALALAMAVAGAVAVAGTIAVAGAVTLIFAGAVAFTVAVAFAVAFAFMGTIGTASTFSVAFAATVAITSLLTKIYINPGIHQGDPKFANLRTMGLALTALGGTNFSGADLTEATFAQAHLKSTNFAATRQRPTILTRVRWHGAHQLDRARLGTSLLQDHRVLALLTNLNGIDQDLTNADLQGANLAAAQLHRANLAGANLTGATLQGAELPEATLTGTQCIGADFTGATLTGACLEAWNIDHTTCLQDVNCQYVFLSATPNHLGWRERLPHNPDKCFAPGDFATYFREVMDEVKLLMRGGVDPRAFKQAFQELMHQHQILPQDVRGIERQGPDVLMRVAVPPDQAKAEVARTFDITYEQALPASTAEALLAAERQHKQEVLQLATTSLDRISQVLTNLTINTTAMTNSNNPHVTTGDKSFYAGGDVSLTNSSLMFNLEQMSGQVTHQITQLPDTATTAEQPSLKDLLTQLQAAVEADAELSDDEKIEALGEVGKLAKASTNPSEGAMRRLAKRATAALQSIVEPLTAASNLATTCKHLLPIIMGMF